MSPAVRVIRWGRSPYEQGPALRREQQRVEALGFSCTQVPGGVFAAELPPAEVLVVNSLRPVTARDLQHLSRLQLLVTTTSGYDHLDLEAARSRGIVVVRLPMARRDAVVEASIAMALSLLRDIPRMQAEARQGQWVRSELPDRHIACLSRVRVGVVGTGVIGSRLVRVLGALGVEVHAWDPAVDLAPVPRMPPAEMLRRCRIVTLHCRHEPGADPVIHRELLEAAHPHLVLVNTARGGVLDLGAAWAALQERRLGALGLDVFPREPYGALARLAAHPRVLVTPHAAGYHDGLAEAIADELCTVLAKWRRGEEPLPHRIG